MNADPRAEYTARLDARRREVERLERRDLRIANSRALVFLVGVGIAWLAFASHRVGRAWVAVPAAAFIALVAIHDRVDSARKRAHRSVTFYLRALGRLDGKWAGTGESGERFADPHHPYTRDLDLFGRGSLFELLATTRTRAGEETLATWLRGPASPPEIRGRQEAVKELAGRLDLREELALLGDDLRREVKRPGDMAAWGEASPVFPVGRIAPRVGVFALGTLALGTLVGWWAGALHPLVFFGVLAVELVLYRWLRPRLQGVVAAVEQAERDLSVLALVLARLEREPVKAARLAWLHAELGAEGLPASLRIAQLARLAHLLHWQRNQIFAPLGLLVLWTVQLAFAVEEWRARHGRSIARWLSAAGELEALAALGGYAWEHPGDPFPEMVDEGPLFEAQAIGHPLLAEAACVRNDVTLGAGARVLLVSGSNMSGKSTLLRTVGSNVVLALAGAPVRARRLRLSPLAVGATLRIEDSLLEGSSRFYAEITRLRQLVDLAAGPRPLLFLLDEILHGTNSHDRRIGAEGVIRGLLERGAMGLVTTHDLALAEMVEGLAGQAENVHFEDHLENGKLVFDYTMRPGVVRKSNALELMRAVGLRV